MQTDDLEQKKLVYLYLMNYAKTQPELVILAVNTFVKDTDDPNPLVRALAIRTMGCLRAEKIIDYLCDPLQKCLRDENPYVRKTAALCVAKLYDLKPELVIDNGFLEQLQEMISDSNPMVEFYFFSTPGVDQCTTIQVVANTVAALTDIHIAATSGPSTASGTGIFIITSSILNKLLIALNECSEWGHVAILNALARCVAQDEKESEHICECIMPQFQHVNGSVVHAAVKVCPRKFMIHLFLKHQSSVYHDSYAKGMPRGVDQAARAQDGATIGDTFVLATGSPMGGSQKYQPSSAKTVRHPVE